MTKGSITTPTASSFPAPNLGPSAMPWGRAVSQRVAQLEDGLSQAADTAAQTNKTLIETLRRTRPGAFIYKGEWATDTVMTDPGSPGTPATPGTWLGAYVDNLDLNTLANSKVIDQHGNFLRAGDTHLNQGETLMIPWTNSVVDTSGATVTFTATFTFTDAPGEVAGLSVGLDSVAPTWILGTPAQQQGVNTYTPTTTAPPPRTTGTVLYLRITGGSATGMDVSNLELSVSGVSTALDTYNPQVQYIAGDPGSPAVPPTYAQVGRKYVSGDAVSYNGAVWQAIDFTDSNPPAAGPMWVMLAGTAADSHAGEWA